ncbi:MAG: virion core protein, T7 gp14 family [Poseidonibacter sp.]
MSWIVVGVTATSAAYSSYQGNKAAEQAQENAERRYATKSSISKQQFDEQEQMQLEKMTDVTRKFMVAKGRAKAIQAEGLTGGITAQKAEANLSLKKSEVKGKVAKETETNIVNIAHGALANKIDTDAMIAEAESRKRNVFAEAAIAGGTTYAHLKAQQKGGTSNETKKTNNSSANYVDSSGNWIGV